MVERGGGDFHLDSAPTEGGPVSLRVENALTAAGRIALEIDAPRVAGLEIAPPDPPGFTLVDGPSASRLPPGSHRLVWRYRRA